MVLSKEVPSHQAGGMKQEQGWEHRYEVTVVCQIDEIIIISHLTQG